ncbi:MAG: hypothetical protein EBS83_04575 [Planctomycetia bacterium]|nr:hypothetical protein [Planctomycetia bacterium]
MVAGLPVPAGGLEPLLPLSALPQQPSPMKLDHQELASLEQLAQRSGPGEVAVTAFRRQAAEMQAEPEAHGQQEVVPDETLPGLKTLSPTPDVTEPTVVKKQVIEKELPGSEHQPEAEETGLNPTNEPSTPNTTVAVSTQGHVSRETEVASPDSLRALVSRTQPTGVSDKVHAAAHARPHEQTSAGATVADAVAAKPKGPDADQPSQPVKPVSRSEGTARGLRSAAAALERVEQQPVESLLTRMLGEPAPKPVCRSYSPPCPLGGGGAITVGASSRPTPDGHGACTPATTSGDRKASSGFCAGGGASSKGSGQW